MRVVWLFGLLVLAEAVSLESSGTQKQGLSPEVQEAVEWANVHGDFWDRGVDPLVPPDDSHVLERAEADVKVPALLNGRYIDTMGLVLTPEAPGRQRIWVGWFDNVRTLHVGVIRRTTANMNSYLHVELYDGCFSPPPIFSDSKKLSGSFLPEKDQWGWVEFAVNQAVEPARYYWLKIWLSKDEEGTVSTFPSHGILINHDQFTLGQLLVHITTQQLVGFPIKKRDIMFVMTGSLSDSSLGKRRYLPTTNIACSETCLPVGTLEQPGVEKQGGAGSRMYHLNILVVEDKTPPDWEPVAGKIEGPDQPGSFDLHDETVVKQDILNMFEGEKGLAHYEPFKSRWRSVDIYMAKMAAAEDFATYTNPETQDRFAKGMWGCANIDLAVELVTPYVPTGKSMALSNGPGSFSSSVYYKTPGSLGEKARQAGHEIGHTLGLGHGWSYPAYTPKKKSKFWLNWVAPGCLEPMGWCTESYSIEDVKDQTIELYTADPDGWIYKGFKNPEPCWSEPAQANEAACKSSGGCIWRDGLGADSFYMDYKCVPKMIVLINLCKEAPTSAIKQGGCYVGPTGVHSNSPFHMNVASPIGDYMYMRDHVPGPPQSLDGYNGANGKQLHKLFTCVFDYRCRLEDWSDCQQFYSFWGDPDAHPENTKFIEKGLGCHERTFKRR